MHAPNPHLDKDFAPALEGFDIAKLDASDDVIYAFDSQMRLRFANRSWFRFARENGAPDDFFEKWGLGARVDASYGDDLRRFFREHLRRSSELDKPWDHEYECPSPTERRIYRMRVYPLDDGWLIVNSLVLEEPADPGRSTDAGEDLDDLRNEHGFFVLCSHCRRTKAADQDDQWIWVPTMLESRRQDITHGFCPRCYAFHYRRRL